MIKASAKIGNHSQGALFHGIANPKLLFVTDAVPDENGTGLEKRAYAFLHAYARFAKVDLLVTHRLQKSDWSRLRKKIYATA